MNKYPTELTENGKNSFLEWVANNCKDSAKFDDGGLYSPEAWIDDFNNSLASDSERRDYEMSSYESASGRPELFRFDNSDLVFAEYDE